MTHEDESQAYEAFERAITNGFLSDKPDYLDYAGHYMFMGTSGDNQGEWDSFKHIITRDYIRCRREEHWQLSEEYKSTFNRG